MSEEKYRFTIDTELKLNYMTSIGVREGTECIKLPKDSTDNGFWVRINISKELYIDQWVNETFVEKI